MTISICDACTEFSVNAKKSTPALERCSSNSIFDYDKDYDCDKDYDKDCDYDADCDNDCDRDYDCDYDCDYDK